MLIMLSDTIGTARMSRKVPTDATINPDVAVRTFARRIGVMAGQDEIGELVENLTRELTKSARPPRHHSTLLYLNSGALIAAIFYAGSLWQTVSDLKMRVEAQQPAQALIGRLDAMQREQDDFRAEVRAQIKDLAVRVDRLR